MSKRYSDGVFINCPFGKDYKPIFEAIVFAIHDCGFIPRCALEIEGVDRLFKIMNLISDCKYGVHDISRTEMDPKTKLPRFNMPLELGIFLGCKRYGSKRHSDKNCIILDSERYRFHKFISDISGQDPKAHQSDPRRAVRCVRNWLRTTSGRTTIPGEDTIWKRYQAFKKELPKICKELGVARKNLTFIDYSHIITTWLADKETPPSPPTGLTVSFVTRIKK